MRYVWILLTIIAVIQFAVWLRPYVLGEQLMTVPTPPAMVRRDEQGRDIFIQTARLSDKVLFRWEDVIRHSAIRGARAVVRQVLSGRCGTYVFQVTPASERLARPIYIPADFSETNLQPGACGYHVEFDFYPNWLTHVLGPIKWASERITYQLLPLRS